MNVLAFLRLPNAVFGFVTDASRQLDAAQRLDRFAFGLGIQNRERGFDYVHWGFLSKNFSEQ
jgi:hypothetical protein